MYDRDGIRLLHGDVLARLRDLPDESVHCVVTSPPYWGLRDYGVDGQIGLEPTPEEYLARMVEVFGEVRRVLRADGTCWVNMGSSYFSGARTYGNGGKASKGSRDYDCPSIHLCDACRDSLSPHIVRTHGRLVLGSRAYGDGQNQERIQWRGLSLGSSDSSHQPQTPQSHPATNDQKPSADHVDGQPHDVLVSTIDESWPPPPGECWHCANCGACLSVLRSSSRDARECVRTGPYIGGRSVPLFPWDSRIAGTDLSFWAWGYSTTAYLKPKDDIMMPSMLALAFRADGWYVRSDIIWQKPNPMPESCTDRPTSAHEHIFLLSKSARYYYDAEAVRTPAKATNIHDLTGPGYKAPGQTKQNGNRQDKQRGHSRKHAGFNDRWDGQGGTAGDGSQPAERMDDSHQAVSGGAFRHVPA